MNKSFEELFDKLPEEVKAESPLPLLKHKISFVIITARDNYPYTGRPDLHIFEPLVESLKAQTMKDFELIVVDVLYDQRKGYFKGKDLPFKIKHIPSAPNIWHDNGLIGVCTQYNKGIIHADGELVFFTGDGFIFIPEFCERLWKHYKEGYVPLAWYFIDHTFSPVFTAPTDENKLPYGISYNMFGYNGKFITMDHRPLHAFKDSVSVYDAPWEWYFGCSSAPLKGMLKINGFDHRFDGDRLLLDCDVGSRLQMAGYGKFGLFKDLYLIRLVQGSSWSPQAGLNSGVTVKCNYPLIYWSRNFGCYFANDHENIDDDIKWCKEVYCVEKCSIREECKKNHPYQYPFEHKEGYQVLGNKSQKKWFDFWRTHQVKTNLAEEREKRLAGEQYTEGTFL